MTHELRTPLTTFRMYAEMLARGMVPDAARRQEYFNTLQREAERLTLLVENVLAYARLERGRKPQAQDRVTLAALLERVGPRLAQRAAAGRDEVRRAIGRRRGRRRNSRPTRASSSRFCSTWSTTRPSMRARRPIGGFMSRRAATASGCELAVRDHGPGIQQRHVARRMQPFGKSAQESAETAPGVGLGLALCRRLARQLGGRLEIAASTGGGATVTLLLPASMCYARQFAPAL